MVQYIVSTEAYFKEMNQTCPQCYSQLASSEVGNLCVNCGYLQRRHHNHAPVQDHDETSSDSSTHQHDDHTMPGNLEAPRGLDALLFSSESATKPQAEPLRESFDTQAPEPREKPQIINHHSSSQYRRRLERQLQTLETPEIESSIEPDSTLEAAETAPGAPHSENPATLPTTVAWSSQPTESAEEDVIEVHEPHRPSPYLINMADTDTEVAHPTPEYHSPLHTPPKPAPTNDTPNHPHSSSPTTSTPPQSEAALARADALLAAAASPQKASATAKTNYIIIAVTIIILLGIGSFLAFTLLRKPTPQTSTAPSTSSNTVQSSSPTPTNLTESAKRDAERKDTLNTIAIALAAYKKANGTYPSGNDIAVLSALTSSNPPFLREIKTDPLSNTESGVVIKYGYSSDGAKFTLTASLENKQDPDAVNGLYVVKSP